MGYGTVLQYSTVCSPSQSIYAPAHSLDVWKLNTAFLLPAQEVFIIVFGSTVQCLDDVNIGVQNCRQWFMSRHWPFRLTLWGAWITSVRLAARYPQPSNATICRSTFGCKVVLKLGNKLSQPPGRYTFTAATRGFRPRELRVSRENAGLEAKRCKRNRNAFEQRSTTLLRRRILH